MRDPVPGPTDDNRLRELVEAYCNGTDSDSQFAELEERLAGDAAARDFYLRYMCVESALEACGDGPQAAWGQVPASDVKPAWRRWSGFRALILLAPALLIAAAVIGWRLQIDNENEKVPRPRVVGVLEQVQGQVSIAAADGRVRPAQQGTEITSGDTVRTQDSPSAATLLYPDGTRLSLVGTSSLTATDAGRKSVVLHGGIVFASVVAQPVGRPMLVTTPRDSVEVLGTKFTLGATTIETDLSVSEGRVRLTRLQDGQSVEVPAGQRVVSSAAPELQVKAIRETADEWNEDFEDGLPRAWTEGKFTADRLPPGSKGAVQAERIRSGQDELFNITTQPQWTSGLFAVREKTHLHITLKMQDPGWFNILILTKTADSDPPAFAGNYIFDQPVWRDDLAGEWGTLTIPLSEFRSLSPGSRSFENAVPIQMIFSSPDRDRGLVIDRMWITRGGPGRVESKRLEKRLE